MDQNTNQNSEQQPNTQPAGNGDQGGEKLFTQEEVNDIVKDRLARERAKNTPQEPTEEEKRTQDLNARENRIACREYIMDQCLPTQLLDVLNTSNHEDFKNKADIVSGLLAAAKPAVKTENPALAEMKLRIAYEKGIPTELAARLKGETEKELYQDAATVQAIVRAIKGPPPMHEPGPSYGSSEGGMYSGFKKTKHTPKQY